MTGYPDDDATKRADRERYRDEEKAKEAAELRAEIEAQRRYKPVGVTGNRAARRRAYAIERKG